MVNQPTNSPGTTLFGMQPQAQAKAAQQSQKAIQSTSNPQPVQSTGNAPNLDSFNPSSSIFAPSSSSSKGPANYSPAQLAQMYNAANAASTNPQPVNYSVGSSGNLQASTSPNAASTAPTYASTVPTVSTPSPTAATTAYTNANTPAAQQYLALARAYGVPITQQAINNANSASNPINRGIYGGYAQTPSTANHAAQAPSTAQSGLPSVDYQTFGTSAKVSFQDPHGSAFTATVELPGGNTFTYSGNVEGVPLGTINAKDQAVEQAWGAYQAAQQSLQNVPAGSSMTVTQGNNGLNLNINTAAGTSLPTQTVTVAPGLTFTGPTSVAAAEAAAALLSSSFMNSVNPSKTYTSQGITFTGSQLQNMYESYESQINTALTQENPQVTVSGTTASFNSLTPAEQQQYVQQQADNYLQSLQYNGAGYYNINGKNVYISNPNYYATMLGNGAIGQYEGTAAPQAPVSTPTFTTSTGSPAIELPQGWSTDTNGNLYVNGNAPTLQQSEQYANAYAGYLSWYQANNPNPTSSSTNAETPPPVPNWYNTLLTAPSGGASAANLAALQYVPIVPTAPPTPLQGVEAWLGQNVVNPVEAALAPAGKVAENYMLNQAGTAFNNYVAKPFEQYVAQPAEQFGQNVLNTPLPSLQQLSEMPLLLLGSPNLLQSLYSGTPQVGQTSIAQEQQPTTIGSLLNSAGTSASSFINNNVAQPIYNWWYNNYVSPKTQQLRALESLIINQYNTQQQSNANVNPLNEAFIALENALMTEASNTSEGHFSGLQGFNPYSLEASILANTAAAQNVPAGFSHLISGISNFTTGSPTPTLPYNPAANMIYSNVSQEAHNLNTLLNEGINQYIQLNAPLNKLLPSSVQPYAEGLETLPGEILNYGILQPAEALVQGNFNVSSPYSSNAQKALGLATVASSVAMPGKAAMYGLGSGLINVGANYLFGSPQSSTAAMRSGYQFGAATAPLFEGAQLLGAAAQKFLAPTAREILFMASQTTDPTEQESLLKTLQLVIDHPQLSGMARYLLRTAPVNSVFGALQAGEAYLSGVRNPAGLLTNFGLGYGFGTGLEFVGSGIGSAIGILSTAARDALSKTGIITPVKVNVEMGDEPGVLAMLKELPDNKDLLYNLIDRSIGRFGIDTTPLKDLSIDDLRSIIATNPQFFLDVSSIAQTDLPVNVLLKDISSEKVPTDKVSGILRMMNIDTTDMSESAQRNLLISKLKMGDVPKYLLTRGFTLANTFDFLPQDIKANLLNAAQDPSGDVLVHLTSTPGIIKGSTISIDVAQNPTFARSVTMSGLSKYSSAPGTETTALGYAQYANPFAEETEGSIPSAEFRGSRYYGQVEPLNFYPKDWSERVDFAKQYYPNALSYLSKTYSPSGFPEELRNFDFFYTMQAAHDGLHIQTPVPEYYGAGELETGTPATGKLIQGNKFDIITVRPNQGIFKDTPFEKLFPTFVRGTYRTAYLTPESWNDVAKALKDSKNPAINQEFEAVKTSNLVDALEHKTPIIRDAGRGIITDSEGNIYLVHEVGRPTFSLPGGGIKDGEDPLAATTREVSEELKVNPSPKSDEPIVKDYLGSQKTFFTSGAPFRDNTDAWNFLIDKNPQPDMKEIDAVIKVKPEGLAHIKVDTDGRFVLSKAIPDLPNYQGVSVPTTINKVVFDLDGTLIDGNGNLRPGAIDLLNSLKNKGVDVALWTHSPYDRTEMILKDTGLDNYFDIKDKNQVVTREDYAGGGNEHTFKDIKKIGGDVLIENDPIQAQQQLAAGNYALQTSTYKGGNSYDLYRVKNILDGIESAPSLKAEDNFHITTPSREDIETLHNEGIMDDGTYNLIKSEFISPSVAESIPSSTSESVNSSVSPSITQSVSESVSPSVSEITSPSVSESVSPSVSSSAYSTSESVSPSTSYSASSPSVSESPSLSSPSYSPSGSSYGYSYSPTKKPIILPPEIMPFYAPGYWFQNMLYPGIKTIPATATEYSQDISTMLIPELATAGVESTRSPLLGIAPRPAPELVSGPKSTPYTLATPNSYPALDMPTSGPLTRREQQTMLNLANVVMPAQEGILPEQVRNAKGFQAEYMRNPRYYAELQNAYMRQMQENQQRDIARNYQTNLYLRALFNNLKGIIPLQQLEAMLRQQQSTANAQYYNTPAQVGMWYNPNANAEPSWESILHRQHLERGRGKNNEVFA